MRAKQATWSARVLETKTADGETGPVGQVRAVVSVFGNVDQQGDRVVKGAFADTLADWQARGDPIPFVWSHQWGNLDAHVGAVPPGRAVETDRGLEVAADLPLDDPPSAKVYRLLAERRITQFSFAFDILEEVETDEDNPNGPGWWGPAKVWELRKLRLFECGPCLLGANEQTELLEVASRQQRHRRPAVRTGTSGRRRRGKQDDGSDLSDGDLSRLEQVAEAIDTVDDSGLSDEDAQALADAFDLIETVIEHVNDSDGDGGPQQAARARRARLRQGAKGAVSSHETPTDDGDWDGAAAERNLADDADAAVYRKVYAWADPDGDPDTQAAYKLPHHLVSADGTPGAASVKGCQAAVAALNGGRGGANIPAGDLDAVHGHLAKHLKDADADVPPLGGDGTDGEAAVRALADLALNP